eukprot:1920388-Rhodomonas_salina.1
MLYAVNQAELYEGPALETAICEYRAQWLPRLDRTLLWWNYQMSTPTLDICWVWYLHKLDPVAYQKDCITAFGRVLGVPDRSNPFQFDIDCRRLPQLARSG